MNCLREIGECDKHVQEDLTAGQRKERNFLLTSKEPGI